MERLTTNKDVQEMGMYELVHNCCYIEDGKAVYRDYNGEVDARELTRTLYQIYCGEELSKDDDVFDDEILEELQYDPEIYPEGLIALFYRNLWAMAELREQLKAYEDAEEQGLLLRLPCAVNSTVYLIKSDGKIVPRKADMQFLGVLWDDYGKEWYLTEEEAEQALKQMESEE